MPPVQARAGDAAQETLCSGPAVPNPAGVAEDAGQTLQAPVADRQYLRLRHGADQGQGNPARDADAGAAVRIEVNDRDLEHIADVMIAARKLQEYIWGDTRTSADNFEHWKEALQKRLDKIEKIDFSKPHAVIELRKRLLQNATVSVVWLRALDILEAEKKNEHLA
jgi:hypothetical protein